MDTLHVRCAGLDVHKDTVVACVRVVEEGKSRARTEVLTFGTTTSELCRLGEWLQEEGVTVAVLESTGVYWKPVWHVLSEYVDLVLGNAKHLKGVPGRKSDVADAVWLADLLAHGLVRASFVPPEPIVELRDLTRTRKQLVRDQTRHVQRIQKTLEDANIKLSSFISDIMGKSGRAMILALIDGQTDPAKLANLGDLRLKATPEQLMEALRGRVTPHHRILLKLHLDQYDAIARAIADLDVQIDQDLLPFREAADRLEQVPGLSKVSVAVIVSEIGHNMERFPSAGHLVSWAGLCPQMDESAGRRRSTRIRKGAPWLKTTLVQCAWSAIRKKDSYYKAQYHRICGRRGPKKAIIAVAASMLTAIYHILRDQVPFVDLTASHFAKRDEDKLVKSLTRRLSGLGYAVEVKKAA